MRPTDSLDPVWAYGAAVERELHRFRNLSDTARFPELRPIEPVAAYAAALQAGKSEGLAPLIRAIDEIYEWFREWLSFQNTDLERRVSERLWIEEMFAKRHITGRRGRCLADRDYLPPRLDLMRERPKLAI